MFTPFLLAAAFCFNAEPSRSDMYRDVFNKVDLNKRQELAFSNTITTTHELSHEIHHVNSKKGFQALYTGSGKLSSFPIPSKVNLIDVNKFVPDNLRRHRFETYVTKQSTDRWEIINGTSMWIKGRNDNPLYLLDEWVSYNNGAKAGLEEAALGMYMPVRSDLFLAPLELLIYSVGMYQAIAEIEPEYLSKNPEFTKFMKNEVNRALDLFSKGQKDPKLKWETSLLDDFVKSSLFQKSKLKLRKDPNDSSKFLP